MNAQGFRIGMVAFVAYDPTYLPDGLLTVIRPSALRENPFTDVIAHDCERRENAVGWWSASAPHMNPFANDDVAVQAGSGAL